MKHIKNNQTLFKKLFFHRLTKLITTYCKKVASVMVVQYILHNIQRHPYNYEDLKCIYIWRQFDHLIPKYVNFV